MAAQDYPCARCWSYRPNPAPGTGPGECWSAERLDGDPTHGPADHTRPEDTCEAWIDRATGIAWGLAGERKP